MSVLAGHPRPFFSSHAPSTALPCLFLEVFPSWRGIPDLFSLPIPRLLLFPDFFLRFSFLAGHPCLFSLPMPRLLLFLDFFLRFFLSGGASLPFSLPMPRLLLSPDFFLGFFLPDGASQTFFSSYAPPTVLPGFSHHFPWISGQWFFLMAARISTKHPQIRHIPFSRWSHSLQKESLSS